MTTLFRSATLSFLVLIAVWPAGEAACVPGPTTLCLTQQRFSLDVQWKDFQGNTGVGQAVPLTSDTGYFWFFSSNNVELVVKVLDARPVNGHFWVFYGALSNVEYTMKVTDTVTGSVKTYFNPSGQFASVGDTEAFSSSGIASSTFQTVDSSGSSATANPFTLRPLDTFEAAAQAKATCVAAETSLCLNGGRFRVEVNWKDFQGGTGTGKAISLTSDTGYFWFFSSNNVELVVKVLDGRVLNNRFWVFYGALSNVEYRMTVTDTLTGNVNTYVNPSGRFASTGDTGAFPAGHSVAVRLDESRAVSADIPTTGGTISATAGDGTVFTLTIPNDALLSESRITMTPVVAIEGLPLSGGLASAVDLAPTGLRLFQLATLTIAPPAPVPLAEEITFAWRGSGEEFFLYPPELDKSKISMKLIHFSGYGVGRGSAADQAAQQQRVPASPEDALSQRLQELFASRRRAQSNGPVAPAQTDAEFAAQVYAQFREYYDQTLKIPLEIAKTDCGAAKRTLLRALSWARQVVLLGFENEFASELQNISTVIVDALVYCYNEAFDKCVNQNDPAQVKEMLGILRQLQLLGAEGRVDQDKIERCVRFELHFESLIQSDPAVWSWQYRAVVPIRVDFSTNTARGSAPAETFKMEYIGPEFPCPSTISTRSAVFEVVKLTIEFNVYEGSAPPPEPVIMVFDPGRPGGTWTISCPAPAPPSSVDFEWIDLWNAFGHIGNSFPFIARGWQRVGGAVYARKTYQHPQPYPGTTLMDLKHTPQ